MAKNLIRYEARLINSKTENGQRVVGDARLEKTKNGKGALKITVAEQFQERNDRAPQKFKDATKAADAWVNTETKWHRITIFGSLDAGSDLMKLVTDPNFNHGAILEIDASYRSEGYTRRKDNVNVQDDRESVFLDGEKKDDGWDTFIGIKTSQKGNLLGASEGFVQPIYRGGDIPEFGGGGGKPPAPEYDDNEGF